MNSYRHFRPSSVSEISEIGCKKFIFHGGKSISSLVCFWDNHNMRVGGLGRLIEAVEKSSDTTRSP